MSQSGNKQTQRRISTGIPGLDRVLHGGLLPGRSYLVVGAAGTGKTMMGIQWLLSNTPARDSSVYMTLAEPAHEIIRNTRSFGWDPDIIDFVDLSPVSLPSADGDYQIFEPAEVEQADVWKKLIETLETKQPKRLVIDSATQLSYLSTSDYQFRKQLLSLVAYLGRIGCTTYFIYEPTEMDKGTAAALAVDGIIRLDRSISSGLAIGLRSLQVEKLRGSDFLSGLHAVSLTARGMEVFPHYVETLNVHPLNDSKISSGITQLDKLLGGGLEGGTSTLLTGPAGAGKTTVGLEFLVQAAGNGRKGILYTFEESVEMIGQRCRAIGIDIDTALKSNALKIERVNPMELYPDQLLGIVRNAVEDDERQVVMIDSLRGYELAMQEFGMPKAHIHNLTLYLNRMGVTTLLVSEVENITGLELRATDLGVSHLADTVILMRYAEYEGEVIKIINCLKKRLGESHSEIRELRISRDGVEVRGKLENLRGLLTGVPHEMTRAP